MKPVLVTLLFLLCIVFASQVALGEDPCKELYSLYKRQCVGSPKSSEAEFPRADWNVLGYYSEVSNEDNFWVYCKGATGTPAAYKAFKNDVCTKKPRQPQSKQNMIPVSEKEIKTRHGNLTLVDKDGGILLLFKNKQRAEYPGPFANFDKKAYKVGDANVFVITFAMGASAGGINLIIDKPDGLYLADDVCGLSGGADIKFSAGKLTVKEKVKFKKYQITEYDGNTLTTNYDGTTEKWVKRNIPLKKFN